MSFLTQFGLSFSGVDDFVPAIRITDEVSVLLQQQGISPEFVNKVRLPAGYTGVGSMSILCYLPSNTELFNGETWAVFGPMKWLMSTNYRIHRIFGVKNLGGDNINETLAVVTFDDWRYYLQGNVSGTTNHRTLPNQYADDWSVSGVVQDPDEPDGEPEELEDESEGLTPIEYARLDNEEYHLELLDTPSLNDPWHCWDYRTWYSDANFIDRVLTSCGVVGLPYPLLRNGSGDYTSISRGASLNSYMVATYIGDGWEDGGDELTRYDGVYVSGQLQCAWGGVEDYSDAIGGSGITDPMIDKLTDIPGTMPNIFTAHPHDGITGVPESLTIQFPAKDKTTGKLIMYRFEEVTHGLPLSDYAKYTNPIIITDHIKTMAEVEDDSTEELNEEGITSFVIGDEDWNDIVGITEERVEQLAVRALQLSRTYYSRYYACTGELLLQGFQLLYPWAGMTALEYGFDVRGMPYTRVSGDVNHDLYGFNQTDFSESAMVSTGGMMIKRPDGLVDLAMEGRGSKDPDQDVFACIVLTAHTMNPCHPTYDIEVLGTREVLMDVTPTNRFVGGMCYEPAAEDSAGIIVAVKKDPDDDGGAPFDCCDPLNDCPIDCECNYAFCKCECPPYNPNCPCADDSGGSDDPDYKHFLLYLDERVQTKTCGH